MKSPRETGVDPDKHEEDTRCETRCIAESRGIGDAGTRPNKSADVYDVAH